MSHHQQLYNLTRSLNHVDLAANMDTLPPITTLSTLKGRQLAQILDLLFEHSSTLGSLYVPLLSTHPFASYTELIDRIGTELLQLQRAKDVETLDDILAAHPRLGDKQVDSAQSRAEQQAMHDAASGDAAALEAEASTLRELNGEYEQTFPGLRYVVFVNGRPRSAIFEDMRARIARGDIDEERKEAVQAMCDIAKDRAAKLQQS